MKKKRGTSIIEIVIATALISMVVIAALNLTSHTQKQTTYARDLAEATKYTTQAADWIRTQRDMLGYAVIANKIVTDGDGSLYCLNTFPAPDSDFTSLSKGACGVREYIPGTLYNRYMTIDTSSQASGVLKIYLTVTWMEKTLIESTIELELTQWH